MNLVLQLANAVKAQNTTYVRDANHNKNLTEEAVRNILIVTEIRSNGAQSVSEASVDFRSLGQRSRRISKR